MYRRQVIRLPDAHPDRRHDVSDRWREEQRGGIPLRALPMGCRDRRHRLAGLENRYPRHATRAQCDARCRLAGRGVHHPAGDADDRSADVAAVSAHVRYRPRFGTSLCDLPGVSPFGMDRYRGALARHRRFRAAGREDDRAAWRIRSGLFDPRHDRLVECGERADAGACRRHGARVRRAGHEPLRRRPGDRPIRCARRAHEMGGTAAAAHEHARQRRPRYAMAGTDAPAVPLSADGGPGAGIDRR